MSLGAIRNLSPDFVRDVLPQLPPALPPKAFDRALVDESMKQQKQHKDQALKSYWPHLIDEVSIEDVRIEMRDGVQVGLRIYSPRKGNHTLERRRVFYSMHGGGFVGGNIDSEDLINRQICTICNVLIFSIDYRLAPENPVVPTILNDAEDGLKWTHVNAGKYGGETSRGIIVGGTSSGGAMAATLGFRAKTLGIQVQGLLLRQPVFILNTYENAARKEWMPSLKSRVENADAPILSGGLVRLLNELIAVPLEDATDPRNFPIFASREELSRMPSCYVVKASCDPLADEVELFAKLLKEAGVAVKLKAYEGMPHGFHAHHVLQAARSEMKDTAEGVQWLMGLSV